MAVEATAHEIVVIGAGLGGLAVGCELSGHGLTDFLIAERADDLGGTWRMHHYPNVACDTPIELYSYSFCPHPEWSSNYPPGAEILDYARAVAHEYSVADHIVPNATVVSLRWDEELAQWAVSTAEGHHWLAKYVIAAVGRFAIPKIPEVPGLDGFPGPVFHTANWPEALDLTGDTVAIVGGGATSIQVLPYAVSHAAQVLNFVPTPSYVMPKQEVNYTAEDNARFREDVSLILKIRKESAAKEAALTAGRFPYDESVVAEDLPRWQKFFDDQVTDTELRRLLTPRYPYGCRRVLVSNDYYAAISRANVKVIGSRLASIRTNTLVAADGRQFDADVLIMATGYDANRWLCDVDVEGRGGLTLGQRWVEGPEAYLGTTIDGFPNLFLIDGPNAQVTSVTDVLVAHARYAVSCVEAAMARGATRIEVRPEVLKAFNNEINDRLSNSVLVHCDSYFRRNGTNGTRRIVSHWPGSVAELEERLATPELDDYVLS